ncbi:ATP-binding protein [Bdellovibrionota bacterium FG-1]
MTEYLFLESGFFQEIRLILPHEPTIIIGMPAVNILIVDDREDNLAAFNAILSGEGYCLVNATSGEQALALAVDRDFAVVLMDVQMPGMDGLETSRRLRSLDRSQTTPVILLTGMFPDETHIRLGYEVGAVDFISKPYDPRILKSKVAVFVDLFRKTETIRRQEQLLHEASESRFRTIFEQSPLAIQLFSLEAQCVEVNEAWGKLWGKNAPHVFPPLAEALHQALGGQSIHLPPIEHRGRWVEAFVYPVLNERGRVREVAVILDDVSDRKEVETRQRRLEENERLLSDATAALAASLDFRGALARVVELVTKNIADFCSIVLMNEQGELDRVAYSLKGPALSPKLQHFWASDPLYSETYVPMKQVMKTGETLLIQDGIEPVYSAENSRLVESLAQMGLRSVISVPIRGREKVYGVIGVMSFKESRIYDKGDVALIEELGRRAGMAVENSLLYAEAESQRKRLQKAVQARDEFISIASHELKTPVTSLVLHADIAAIQFERAPLEKLRELALRFITLASLQMDRLSRLIDEMLDVSRIENGKLTMNFEMIDLSALVRSGVEEFTEQLKENGVKISLSIEAPVLCRCDRYRMEQVLTNLFTNALKYGAGKPIEIQVGVAQKNALIQVKDHGIGIAAPDHRRIFERFERAVTPHLVGGLGLGLYIVKNIVEAHDGTISVQSELGQGAMFTVSLPLA